MNLTQRLQVGVPLWGQSAQDDKEHLDSPGLHLLPFTLPGANRRGGGSAGEAVEGDRDELDQTGCGASQEAMATPTYPPWDI